MIPSFSPLLARMSNFLGTLRSALDEWGTEERIRLLEESINDKIVARVDSLESNVEDALDEGEL